MGEKFELELTDGKKVEAALITRLKPENKNIEYIYYSVEDNGNDGNISIFASKLSLENGKEIMKDLDNEEERQEAYKLFSETYKSLREQGNK